MKIRKYTVDDLDEIIELFNDTVKSVNSKDYTDEQIKAWVNISQNKWHEQFNESNTFIALIDDLIIGFINIYNNGYIDKLYVHKDYQNQGVANKLCDKAEHSIKVDTYTVNASITAVCFFTKRGYIIKDKQKVVKDSIVLTNYKMCK